MKIAYKDFMLLYDQVIDLFRKEYKKKENEIPNLSQIFRLQEKEDSSSEKYDGPEEKGYSLREALLSKKTIAQRLSNLRTEPESIKARYLYDKFKRVEKKKGVPVTLRSPYDQILFLYLGFKNYEAFKESSIGDTILYTGYYYSYQKHRVEEYKVRINYNRKPNYPGIPHQEFSVEQEGFHDNFEQVTYEGYGYRQKGKLQLVLWRMRVETEEDRLRILVESGENPASNLAMRGSVLAISSYIGRPISSAETVLLRETDATITEADRVRVRRYLLLHRYNFRVNAKTLNLQTMKSRGIGVDILKNFVGIWKTHRLGEHRKNILNSFVIVSPEYLINCYNNSYEKPNMNEQVCLPNITTDDELNTRTISLDCFPKEGANRVSTIMLSIPNRQDKKLKGGMLLSGQDGNEPVARKIIFERVETEQEDFWDRYYGKEMTYGLIGEMISDLPDDQQKDGEIIKYLTS